LTKELDNVIINVQAIFGEELNESGDIQLKIYLEKLNHKQKVIKELISKESIDPDTLSRLHSAVDLEFSTLRVIPAKRGLGKTLKIIPNLIARLNKNIAFNLHCNDIIIDCKLAYDLNTPLIHLIRNAFDHGIEHAHERIKCGKDPDGHVDVTLQILNNNLIVEVKDDGRGLNTEIIKTTALQKNFITGEEAKVLNDKEIHALIFQPGLSTVINANEISGRGMGMDIVLNSVKNVLNGKIRINSVADKGTCITIEIPLTHS
jgi:two-component system chemotaxis sensor kinase CheA